MWLLLFLHYKNAYFWPILYTAVCVTCLKYHMQRRRFSPGPWILSQPLLRSVGSNALVDPTKFCQGQKSVLTHPFNDPLSGTMQVGRYQKKHSPTRTHHGHQTSFINFLHLLRSIPFFLFNLHVWRSFATTSLQVLFGLPLGLNKCHKISS